MSFDREMIRSSKFDELAPDHYAKELAFKFAVFPAIGLGTLFGLLTIQIEFSHAIPGGAIGAPLFYVAIGAPIILLTRFARRFRRKTTETRIRRDPKSYANALRLGPIEIHETAA